MIKNIKINDESFEIGAAAEDHTHTAEDVGAAKTEHFHDEYELKEEASLKNAQLSDQMGVGFNSLQTEINEHSHDEYKLKTEADAEHTQLRIEYTNYFAGLESYYATVDHTHHIGSITGATEVVFDTYTGTGSAMTINLGREPKAVLVSYYGMFYNYYQSHNFYGGLALKGYPAKSMGGSSVGSNVIEITTDGFKAYGNASIKNGVYHYIAWF